MLDNASTFSEPQPRPDSSHTSAEALSSADSSPSKQFKEAELPLDMQCVPAPNYLPKGSLLGASNAEIEAGWSLNRSKVAESPYIYISALPSKNIRDKFIDVLNTWLGVPEYKVSKVKEVTDMLHNSSLILDDFQDDSPLRRGKPSTHTVFGPAQSINSATYVIVKAISKIQEFSSTECTTKSVDMIMTLFQGQAMDLHWSFNAICPSTQEYAQMINDKTGGLFGLAYYLLVVNAQNSLNDYTNAALNRIVMLWGQYFQIRDDYMNLVNTDYSQLKGFCEDLDEGKYSLPLIHAIENNSESFVLPNLLSTRRKQGKLTYQQKVVILDCIKASGGFEYTEMILAELHGQIVTEIGILEAKFGKDNMGMRALAERLCI